MIWIDTRALHLVFIYFQIRITAMSYYGVHIRIIEGKLKIAETMHNSNMWLISRHGVLTFKKAFVLRLSYC